MVIPSILPVSINKVSVRKRGKSILNDISLDLDAVGFTIVMGPNGSGKTTLLRLMHGLQRPSDGMVSWNCTHDIARTRQTFVFQTPVMMRRSVRDNIAYPLRLAGLKAAETNKQASYWAAKVGIEARLGLDAMYLSGGERQKLALARALITQPEVIFLDEPTTNLDGKSTREIETILKDASKNGARIIMTTHDIGQAKRLASEIVFLNKGKVSEHSAAKTFFDNAQSAAAQAYLKGDIIE